MEVLEELEDWVEVSCVLIYIKHKFDSGAIQFDEICSRGLNRS